MVEEAVKSYRVAYERDESGWWVATVRGVRGCHTQGRTVDEARRRIREALELFVDDARKAPIVADVKLPLPGEHRVGNALSAAAVALELGATPEEVATRLSGLERRSARRMEVVTRPDGVTILNDSFNANPESMRAALRALTAIGKHRRTWAVLGEMKELGELAAGEHDALGRFAVREDGRRIVAVGPGAGAVQRGAADEGSEGAEAVWVPDADAALDLLRRQVEPGDVILVKASRAAGLERLAEALVNVEVTGR